MKTFEEKWTAWLDGELTGKELAEFEASLPDKAAAELEKQEALKLGAFLKEQLAAPAMSNAEFFNHQLRAADRPKNQLRRLLRSKRASAKPGGRSAGCFGRGQPHSPFSLFARSSSCARSRAPDNPR